jgi:DNA-binding NarL/FixJ family response regulator
VSERPDALVASIELPGSTMDGVECLRRARERAPGLRIVALSTQHDAFHLAAAAAAGAHVYLPKTVEASELASTVLECLANADQPGSCVSRARELNGNGNGSGVQPALTPRELEILYLVARGYTNAQIAQRLWVTKWTVKFHLANAYRKLGVSNRTQAARYIFDHGLPAVALDGSET